MRILITGAAGAGTTTLGRALAARIGAAFFDADDYFWLPSEPPYQTERDPSERLATIMTAVDSSPTAVVAGSVVDWGEDLENSFSLVIYLWVEADVRVARLIRRESERFGQPLEGFIDWAAQYDEGRLAGPSRATHEQWLSGRKCQVLRIEGNVSVMEAESRVIEALSNLSRAHALRAPLNSNVKQLQVEHRIAAGVLLEDEDRVLLVRHNKPGAYDFWVAPGGGVEGTEDLLACARREVLEECGLQVEPLDIAYIEEFNSPLRRECKIWFTARLIGGSISTARAEASREHIVEAAFLSRGDLDGKIIFPPMLRDEYWEDRKRGFSRPRYVGLRAMEFY